MSSSQSKTLVQQTVHLFVMEGDFKHPPSTTTITPPALLRNPACECQETERVVVRETEREEGGGFGLCIELPKLIPREHSVLRSPPTQAPPPDTHIYTYTHPVHSHAHANKSCKDKNPPKQAYSAQTDQENRWLPTWIPFCPSIHILSAGGSVWMSERGKKVMNEWMNDCTEWVNEEQQQQQKKKRKRRRTKKNAGGAHHSCPSQCFFPPPLFSCRGKYGCTGNNQTWRANTYSTHTVKECVCGGGGDKPVHKYSAARFMRILLLRWFIVCSRAPNQACDAKDGWWRVCVCVMGGGDGVVLL